MVSHRAIPFLVAALAAQALARPDGLAAYEAALVAVPTRESVLAFHQMLAAEPHVAGSPGDRRVIEGLVQAFTQMGLDVRTHEFWAYLARPVEAIVEVVEPERLSLITAEEPLPEDSFSAHPERTPGWNAYSGSGDVTSGVVYANYGTKADFARLAELGVDVTGKIVICRYGGNFRGYKAKFAQQAGAAGVIIFTDPADSGYAKGIPYPEGGFSNSTCIERGSITTLPYSGDPLTPGIEATRDAKRLDPATLDLPKIPVQPVGWASAAEILKRMTGPGVPSGWQGGLPFAYRISGGDRLRVRVKVVQEREIIPTANVIATLRGASEPDTSIIIGCHHDAWVCGAADPTCGTIALLESARAFTQAARDGRAPARTVVFAAWGAEEFGIIGSSEWVEANRDQLVRSAAMYINLDMASMGPDFGSSATPSLRPVISAAAKAVPQARAPGKTVYEAWIARGEDASLPGLPRMGDLGGGSDHVAFLCHAGIPSASMSAGGSKGNSYHSTFDTLPWYWKVVGEDYEPALMVTRMTSATAAHMASAPILPLSPARYGPETRRLLADLTKRGVELGVIARTDREVTPTLARLEGAAVQFGQRAAEVERKLAAAAAEGKLGDSARRRINSLLIQADRAWLSDEGIPGRPWFRSLYAASDEDSGYASWPLPALRWAVEHKDPAALAATEERYLAVFRQLTVIIDSIDLALLQG